MIDFRSPFKRIDIMPTLTQHFGGAFPDPNLSSSRDALLALCKQQNLNVSLPHTNARLIGTAASNAHSTLRPFVCCESMY